MVIILFIGARTFDECTSYTLYGHCWDASVSELWEYFDHNVSNQNIPILPHPITCSSVQTHTSVVIPVITRWVIPKFLKTNGKLLWPNAPFPALSTMYSSRLGLIINYIPVLLTSNQQPPKTTLWDITYTYTFCYVGFYYMVRPRDPIGDPLLYVLS